jgi:hypothetical protein
VIEYYEAQAKGAAGKGIRVARIPGQLERDEVFARIKAAVDPLIEQEVLALTERLLRAIAEGDWPTYEELCAANMTCFEPEARGHLVEGLVRGFEIRLIVNKCLTALTTHHRSSTSSTSTTVMPWARSTHPPSPSPGALFAPCLFIFEFTRIKCPVFHHLTLAFFNKTSACACWGGRRW